MSDLDLDELERLVKAATPGPYHVGFSLITKEDVVASTSGALFRAFPGQDIAQLLNNMSYTASMHPGTTLALIERIRELQTINCQLEGFPYYKCRPCPNCGQHEIWCESYIEDKKAEYQIMCRVCRGHIAIGNTVEEAILKWNA